MQNLWFEDFEDLACDIADKFDGIKEIDEYNDIAIIAKYEEARQIIKELLCIGYDLHSINLHNEMWTSYNDEYVISLTNIGNCCETEIWCEPMVKDGKYIKDTSTIIYVLDNCSSKVLPYCHSKFVFEVGVGYEEECDECNECCECCNNKEIAIEKDGDMHGFSVNRSDENGWSSYSFYSTDMDLVKSMAKLFE